MADGPYWTDERLFQAGRGPVRLAGTSQACGGPLWTKRLDSQASSGTLTPVEGSHRLSGGLFRSTGGPLGSADYT